MVPCMSLSVDTGDGQSTTPSLAQNAHATVQWLTIWSVVYVRGVVGKITSVLIDYACSCGSGYLCIESVRVREGTRRIEPCLYIVGRTWRGIGPERPNHESSKQRRPTARVPVALESEDTGCCVSHTHSDSVSPKEKGDRDMADDSLNKGKGSIADWSLVSSEPCKGNSCCSFVLWKREKKKEKGAILPPVFGSSNDCIGYLQKKLNDTNMYHNFEENYIYYWQIWNFTNSKYVNFEFEFKFHEL